MDSTAYKRARELGLCVRCISLFINPKNEVIVLKDEESIREHVMKRISLEELEEWPVEHVCPCCLNCLEKIPELAEIINKKLNESHQNIRGQSVFVQFVTPPIVETVRIACRTIVTNSAVKLGPFPSWDEFLSRMVGKVLSDGHHVCDDLEAAKVKVEVVLNFYDEINLAYAIDPKFEKSKKRRMPGVQLQVVDYDFAVERKDEDALLLTIRSMAKGLKPLKYLNERLQRYFTDIIGCCKGHETNNGRIAVEGCPFTWKIGVCIQPIYLIGRYRKFSRDISQARWTLTEEKDEEENEIISIHGDDNDTSEKNANEHNTAANLKSIRKGKISVEEIICEAISVTMKAEQSRMHPCGREDIDVRMLGNGRPFVVEVVNAEEHATKEIIQQILDFISSGSGLNADNDVDVTVLDETSHATWATMQHVAEEKRKGYACICWSALKLTDEVKERIESIPQSCGCLDDEGTPCLEITQKTPLRVLHRRSALTRTRHIYAMSVALINDHYFVLNIITSAGAYVKEFVHGDLGRTFPSISSIISSPTDILQLDVTWLYDSFVGNSSDISDKEEGCCGDTAISTPQTKIYKKSEIIFDRLSWSNMQKMPLPSYSVQLKSKIRYCIMGTSFISGVIVDAIRKSKDGEVYCVCGRTPDKLAQFAKEYHITVTYADYSLMLEDEKVDVVYIGLPTYLHAEWVARCAQAGKHILNEKSFAITALEAEKALKVVESMKVFCMEAQMFRCHPILSRLESIVHDEKPLGPVRSVRASFTAKIIDLFNRKAGGSILDLGCYPMSLLRLLFGEPKSISAKATLVPPIKDGDNVFDSASTAEIVMSSGLHATIHTSNNADHNWEFHIDCEKGFISLSDLWRDDIEDTITISTVIDDKVSTCSTIHVTPPENFYTLQIDTVNRHIHNGDYQATGTAMNWMDSINNMTALDMWRKAIGLHYQGFE